MRASEVDHTLLLLACVRRRADSHRRAARKIAAGDLPHRVHHRVGGGPGGQAGPRVSHGADDRRRRHQGPDVQADWRRPFPHGVQRERAGGQGNVHVRRRHARGQSGCVLQAAARHAADARLARRRFPPRQGRRHQRHQGRPARQQRRGIGQGSTVRDALSGDAVRALEHRHHIVAGEDHARRCEGVLQEPVQPVAAHYRNRGRLFSGVPDGHEEGLPGAAGNGGLRSPGYRRRQRSKNRAP